MLSVLLFSVLVPTITLVIFSLFVYRWYVNTKIQTVVPETTTFIFKFDAKNRRVMAYNVIPDRKNIFKKLMNNTWSPIESITNHFKTDEAQKKMRKAFNNLDLGSKSESFDFISQFSLLKKGEYHVSFVIDSIKDDTNYIMRLSWRKINKQKLFNAIDNKLDKQDVIADGIQNYKGFVAFNVVSDSSVAQSKLIEFAHKIYSQNKIKYFISGGFVVFVFFGANAKQTKKQLDSFIKAFKDVGFKIGANHLFDGSAFAASNKVNSTKNLNGVLQLLDFLINTSIKIGRNFISYKEGLNRQEFEKFSEASKSFRLATRAKNIQSKVIAIRYWRSKKKSIEFIIPTIEGIHQNTLNDILRNKNNKDMLIDAHATMIAIDGHYDSAVMFDVNEHWLIENKDKIRYKKAIYLINASDNNSSELQEVVEELNNRGFLFALRIIRYTEDVVTVVQRIKPNFLVIDSSFWNENKLFDSEKLINLMSLKKVSDEQKIKMIFEQPSDLIDEDTSRKIGLHYFYNVE